MPKSTTTITTMGVIRTAMAEAMSRASKGELPINDGKNIVGLGNAITKSVIAELKAQEMQVKLGRDVPLFGQMDIGGDE